MSQHHKAAKWSTHSPKLRKLIKAQLPLPCVDCGNAVLPEHRWDVGHRPGSEQRDGAAPTFENVGPSHRRNEHWPINCNQKAGGKAGAAVTNRAKRSRSQHVQTREW